MGMGMGMGMGSDDDDDDGVMDLTRYIMMVLVIALFIIVVFFIFVHLYSKWYWYSRRHRQTAMADRQQQQRGLDVSFLKIIEFHPKDFEHGLECAICLSELEEGDKARILPKCDHGFHVECIDMWFHSHSTCPICRDQISQRLSASPTDDVLMNENHHQEEPSSSSSSSTLQDRGIRPDLVIDIPAAQHNQQEQEQELSSTRCSSGMRSLKRMFSPGSSSNVKSFPLTPKSPTPTPTHV